ncbi:DUF4145 domain-containing protein [Paenibacillus tundrae]|uniref:DUF4145 domain-containing protein n=1 Tax=Paenibacillus tundrae TaxID=528187 RepID=UPI0030D4ECAE
MQTKYFIPDYRSDKFSCPYCEVYTTQSWDDLFYGGSDGYFELAELAMCTCDHCFQRSYWYKSEMIIPVESYSKIPSPHQDMPIELVQDYEEARSIAPLSPRGAAALLRLVLEKLLTELVGENSKGINDNIKLLVRNGLPQRVEQALDIVRVVGNNAVHPGKLDLKDDNHTTLTLFGLINFIVENQITQPKMLNELYNQTISEGQREQIEMRERPVPETT